MTIGILETEISEMSIAILEINNSSNFNINRLDQYNEEHEFGINLRISDNQDSDGSFICQGYLPWRADVFDQYLEWKNLYDQFLRVCQYPTSLGDPNPEQPTHTSDCILTYDRCKQAERRLEIDFNRWLQNIGFANIRQSIAQNHCELILIRTNNIDLRRLPWNQWRFLQENNIHREVGMLPMPQGRVNSIPPNSRNTGNMNILVILDPEIAENQNTEQTTIEHQIQSLPSRITNPVNIVITPSTDARTILEAIRNEIWNVLIFILHGNTQVDGNSSDYRGEIQINDNLRISTQDLSNAFNDSIQVARNKNKLIISTCCNSLGLAHDLIVRESLNIPIIAMRERVITETTILFVERLLNNLASDQSNLNCAVNRARQYIREEELDRRFPGSELPVICYPLSKRIPLISWETLTEPEIENQLSPLRICPAELRILAGLCFGYLIVWAEDSIVLWSLISVVFIALAYLMSNSFSFWYQLITTQKYLTIFSWIILIVATVAIRFYHPYLRLGETLAYGTIFAIFFFLAPKIVNKLTAMFLG